MNTQFNHPFTTVAGARDYSKDLEAMKRTVAKADKDPAYGRRLLLMSGMYTKSGQLKKQFR